MRARPRVVREGGSLSAHGVHDVPRGRVVEGVIVRSRRFYGDDLARIHRDGFEAYALGLAPRLLKLIPRSASVLDLGCGAGVLASVLARRGCMVTGVDVSPAMIRLARERVPQARFMCASIAEAPLEEVDAVIAIGEVIHYLADGAEVRRVFRRVRSVLRPEGIFVCDALLPARARVRSVARDADEWALFARIEERPRRVVRRITCFVRDRAGRWRRSRETHVQRLYAGAWIARELRAAGFRVRREGVDARHALFVARG